MIDRLERRGYVERIPNPEDRRSALVRITKSGLEESLGHLWPYIEEMKGVEEGFSEEERAVVARFLRAATRATQRAAEGDEWAHGIAGRYSGSSTGASRNKRSCLLARTYADFRELYFPRCWVNRDI
jgi:hypothetical protein